MVRLRHPVVDIHSTVNVILNDSNGNFNMTRIDKKNNQNSLFIYWLSKMIFVWSFLNILRKFTKFLHIWAHHRRNCDVLVTSLPSISSDVTVSTSFAFVFFFPNLFSNFISKSRSDFELFWTPTLSSSSNSLQICLFVKVILKTCHHFHFFASK